MRSVKIAAEEFLDNENALTIKIIDPNGYYLDLIKEILESKYPDNLENISYFDFSKNKNPDDLINIFNTYPCFAKFRYVVISGIKPKDSETIDKVSEYILDPMPTTKHLFLLEDDKIKIDCEHETKDGQSEVETIKFIEDQLKEKNLTLKGTEIKSLAEKTKNKLSIQSYIEKLDNLNNSGSLSQSLIVDLLEDQINDSFKESYDLITYINKKNLAKCLVEVQKTRFKENIFLEISRITWRFRTYLKIKSLKNAAFSNEEIIKSTKISKYQYKYFDQEVMKKTTDEILNALRTLKNVDSMLKRTDLHHDNIILHLFKKLCGN